MAVAKQIEYMKAIGDAFVKWKEYRWRCYWGVDVYEDEGTVEYYEYWRKVIKRNNEELYIMNMEDYSTQTMKERTNYILSKYKLGKIVGGKLGWRFIDMDWNEIPRCKLGNGDKYLSFSLNSKLEFTYINI